MKKLLIFSLLFFAAFTADASPGKGGYLGHRIILGGEFSYAPFYTSIRDFYTKYDLQYGGNLNVIVARRMQIGFNYNMWSLRFNDVYEGNFVPSDRVKGTEYGITIRSFRKKRGGLAPIGKFWDIGLSYSQNKFVAGADNPDVMADNAARLPQTSDELMVHAAFGTQMVFWDHLVANTGLRFGTPLYTVNSENGTSYGNFIHQRLVYKEAFSVFFGVGLLI